MSRLWAISLVVALTVAPLAVASQVDAALIATGSVSFSPRASSQLDPLGALILDTANISAFDLTFPSVKLCHYQQRFVNLGVLPTHIYDPTSTPDACYPLTNVTITPTDGDQAGWFGIVASPGATMQLSADSLQASARTILTTAGANTAAGTTGGTDDYPAAPEFHREFLSPNVNGTGIGNLTLRGPGEIKFLGPDVLVKATENTTTIRTGASETSAGNPGSETKEWVYLEFSDSNVSLDSAAPILLAAKQVTAFSLDGVVNAGAAGRVDGRLTGSAAPANNGRELDVRLAGDVRSTNVASIRVVPAAPVRSGIPPWIGVLGIGAVVGGGVYAAVIVRRERARRAATTATRPVVMLPVIAPILARQAAVYERRAHEARDDGAFDKAEALMERAVRKDPARRGELLCEKGTILVSTGRVQEALTVFEEAAKWADDGEAESLAADCALTLDMPGHAERLLLRALDRPHLDQMVLERIAHDSIFSALREHESVQQAILAAAENFERRGA